MNLHEVASPDTITDINQLPPGYLEKIVSELTQEAPVDAPNNLIRILLLLQRASRDARDDILERLVDLIYCQSDEFDAALAPHLDKLMKEVTGKKARRA